MADMVRSGEGWGVSPADYATRRPATFAVGLPRSQYITMRDGCRLALDVYLPQSTAASDAPRSRLPTILILTPYYRRFKLRPGAAATMSFGFDPLDVGSTKTILVSTSGFMMRMPATLPSISASRRALAWSSANRSTL